MQTNLNSKFPTQLLTLIASWRLSVLAVAMGVLMSAVHLDVAALALGRVTALSALGEPLVASIEIPDINAEELASLKTSLATPEAFRAAGMEYNSALESAQITLTRRENGTTYLLLRSDKVVTDPFINLIINTNWATGRVVRNYTLLIDPPVSKQSEAVAIVAPLAVLPSPVAANPVAVTPVAATPPVYVPVSVVAPQATQSSASIAASAPSSFDSSKQAPGSYASKTVAVSQQIVSTNSGDQVKVANGDTAGKIAASNLPNNVSLEQMLVAMLRGNPQAFVSNNINRLKAGVVLNMPTETEAAAFPANEAKRNVVAQSKDFNSFKRKLAESAPVLASKASKSSDRAVSGKIEAKVQDQKTALPTPDKLTLSKGGLKAGDKAAVAVKENLDKIAKERQAKDDAARSTELAKNIQELNKVANNTQGAGKPVTAPVSVNAPVVGATPAVVPPKTSTTATPTPTPTPTKPAVVAQAPVITPSQTESGVLDFLMDDPAVLPAAGGALALLLLGSLYANNKRKKRAAALDAEDDALLHASFEEKSFFRDTENAPTVNSTQRVEQKLDPVFDAVKSAPIQESSKSAAPTVHIQTAVDPLKEADVYLGYNRDVQAEEILLDGVKKQPDNVDIYTKLLGIYAKRKDAKKFEETAVKAKLFLSENDPKWIAVCQQGLALDPRNPVYLAVVNDNMVDPIATMNTSEFATHTMVESDSRVSKSPASVDLDLDFNFASSFPANSVGKSAESVKKSLVEVPDFSLEPTTKTTSVVTSAASASAALLATLTGAVGAQTLPATKPIELDFGHLSLDLNNTDSKAATLSNNKVTGPLETKLALATEFYAIGDKSGAKMLVNEVLAQATGNLKARAETLLAEIG